MSNIDESDTINQTVATICLDNSSKPQTMNLNCLSSDLPVTNCVVSENIINDKSYVENEKIKNILNKDIPLAPSLQEQVDEDDVLAGDETSSKDFDGNIDEDELLKDTEGDNNIIKHTTENKSTFPKTFNPVENSKTLTREKLNGEDLERGLVSNVSDSSINDNCPLLNESEKPLNTSLGEQNTVSKINLSSPSIDKSCSKNGDNTLEVGKTNTDVSDSDGISVTEFLQVDQETVQEDTTDIIELNDEDPFGQTLESKDKSIEIKNVKENNIDQQDNKENKPNGEREVIEIQKPVDDFKETDVNKHTPLSLENSNSFQNKNNEKSDSKNVSKETISDDKCSKVNKNNHSSEDSDNNDVCIIIPDSVQDPVANKVESTKNDIKVKATEVEVIQITEGSNKDKQKKKTEETDKTSLKENESVEVQTPSRPQRQAAKKAESQIKQVLLDTDDGVLDDEDDADDDDVNLEEIQYDVDDDDDLEIDEDADIRECTQCHKIKPCTINVITYGKTNFFCGDDCFTLFRRGGNVVQDQPPLEEVPDISIPIEVIDDDDDDEVTPVPVAEPEVVQELDSDEPLPNRTASAEEFTRKCSQCSSKIVSWDDKTLSWETMDFCNEDCLGKYQNELGSHCANCKGAVLAASLGKYCVRFGYDIKQFCCATCLEEFKKGLKVCSFCQKDISSGAEGFLAPVGDKGQFKDFCTQACMEKYEQMSNNVPPPPQSHPCNVCNNNKIVQVEVLLDTNVNKLCSEVCFAAFKFVNNLKVEKCDMCKKYFDREGTERETFSVFYENAPHSFCCKTCMNVYILAKRKIVPCNWCKVKKYNFDMIKRVLNTGQAIMMCSLNCLTLYQVSINAVSSRRIQCDNCHIVNQAQYHLTMSDATIRNFCSYPCVMSFQGQYSLSVNPAALPVISSVTSLASSDTQKDGESKTLGTQSTIVAPMGKIPYKQQIIIKPPSPLEVKNKQTQTRPNMHTKGVSCRPHPCAKETQTEDDLESALKNPIFIPVPVPVYVPTPMAMFSLPFPVPVPFPLPVPVPIFVPTTRNSADGIFKEIKKIQEKMPTDPFEAELLMMAEMVAEEKKEAGSSSEGEDASEPVETSEPCGASGGESGFSPEAMESSNTFGDDMLQMALKMASELEGPAVDLEAALTPATIAQPPPPAIEHPEGNDVGEDSEGTTSLRSTTDGRGRKRSNSRASQRNSANSNSSDGNAQKRSRRSSSGGDISHVTPQRPSPPVQPVQPEEKPDANFRLKYTFGVNAWCQWVLAKNAELEKLSGNNQMSRKLKLFKPEILQLTADELNYSLCLFIKEVKKPNGQEYAPDTIYYLCLGIQQYLFENGRIDNIFTDTYYEKFTDCLDEIAKKFTEIYDDRQYIVTRVEEEHLWESKQLGAHSPHVLLSTLMFFNTKHFNLTTVDEHMQLSFSHIMKHWKRNQNVASSAGGLPKVPGSRNVLLRFYPPQTALESPNSRKKKVYEQQENEDNPLRCPVKLYEFYLSKCPESVRSRSDVFYLQPERSCVPDSPVWYSTMALGKEPLSKMLHRVKMVKEINIALLST